MTVATTTRKMTPQAMDGVTLDFNFTFRALTTDAETIKAFITDGSGVNTDLVYGDSGINGYTVSVNSNGIGGAITVINARTSDYTITIYREVGITQGSDYNDRNSFPAETLESNLDKLTMIAQEIDEEISRSIKVDINSSIDVTLPTASAGKALLWNATADGLENSTDDFNDIVTDATAQAGIATTQAGLADTARAAAQTAQGLAETAQGLAEDWASKTDGQVDSTDYSSKAYAIGGTGVTSAIGASKEWAITAEDTEVTTGNYSALHHAAKAAASALAAQVAKIEWQGTWSAGTYQANDAVEKDGTSYIATTTTTETPSVTATDWDVLALKGTDSTGAGDVSTDATSSVDSEIALYDSTTGKKIKRCTLSGIAKMTSGVVSAGTAGTDYSAGTAALATGILKSTTTTGDLSIATANDIPNPMTTRGDILYYNGTNWDRLEKGTAGQVLTQGANDPSWATPAGGTIYGTCSTASGTAAKTVSYSGFTLETGATINVVFSNANTAAAPTLNVNSTGAKSIALEDGTTASSTYPAYFPASSIITFVYDGSKWRFKNNIVKNYVSGTSWYRIWADGFKEQGGRVAASSGSNPNESKTISLAIAFSNTNYNVQSLLAISAANAYAYGSQLLSKSTSSMVIYQNNSSANGLEWRAAGY